MHTISSDVRALARNVAALTGLTGARRPSIAIGLRLLASGHWSAFIRQLRINASGAAASAGVTEARDYDRWIAARALTDERRSELRTRAAALADAPTISVIMPVYNTPEPFLREAIGSVMAQLYPRWELCIADDASPAPHVQAVLQEYAARDPRVKVTRCARNGGISAASNAALALASGPYVALLDHDDVMAEHALLAVAERLTADPSLDMLYSDEDKLDETGRRCDPFFKPQWSPEYFLACMYTCHLGVYRRSLIERVGGFRSEFDGAQDYDLVLRVVEQTSKIAHLPDVLYHWRVHPGSTASGSHAKPTAHLAARRAIEAHLARTNRAGSVEQGPADGYHRVRYAIAGKPRVSVIIPSACRPVSVEGVMTYWAARAVESIRARSTWDNIEIILVNPGDIPADLARTLDAHGVRRVTYAKPFNFSQANNAGAAAATGEHFVLLNDDTQIESPDWIEQLLMFSQQGEIGAVGAKLLFPTGRLQHCGVIVNGGNPGHAYYELPCDWPGYFNSALVHRNYSAVTAACMMTRAELYRSMGGLDESFHMNYNDIDYCLRLRRAGFRIVWTPHCVVRHHESVSKSGVDPREIAAFHKRWRDEMKTDPAYNPNFRPDACDYQLAI